MMNLKRNLLSTALASAALMVASGAQAQSTQPAAAGEEAEKLDSITVTGIRRSIEKSIETKKAETSIVEAISSEDIGKLPDVSIADSIARLPGLTAQRFGGRAQEINIRGFSGDFSTTTLNGREQVSLGNNRGVEFDQYPSELMSQVVVYKTQESSLVGQGLSGTVDLRTVRPLRFQEPTVAVNVRGDMNDLDGEKRYGNRFSVSYIDQFADRTVGLALGYARLNNPSQSHQFESWGYNGGGFIDGGKAYDNEGDNTRDGFMGVLEYKPSDFWSSTLDVFYSKFDRDENRRGIEFGVGLDWSGATASNVQRNANGTVTSARVAGLPTVVLRNDSNFAHDEMMSVGWRNEFEFAEAWKLSTDLSYSSADREERLLETYSGVPGARDSLTYSLDPAGFANLDFGYDYGDANIVRLGDAGGWGQDGYLKDFQVKDELRAARVDLTREFSDGPFAAFSFGVNLSDRTKSRASDEYFLCLKACRDGAMAPVPAGTGSAFPFAGVGGVYGYDASAALDSLYRRVSNRHPDIDNKNWEVDERQLTSYVQLDIDTEWWGAPLKGNVGVQAIRTEQESTGVATFNGVALSQPSVNGAEYTNYLPSLNLKLELPDELFIRMGLGRQMARPRMDDLRGNVDYGYDRTQQLISGSGGNPQLRPWVADAFDIGFEKYFADTGYVSMGYFYKDLQTFIYKQRREFDRATLPIPPQVLPPDLPANVRASFEQPLNGEGGTLQGLEFAVSIPLEVFWEPLRGFGFMGNYSIVGSRIRPNGPGQEAQSLPGLSKNVSNMTLFFERWGFSARLSQRRRSDYRGEVQGFGGDRFVRNFEGETVSDLQLGYQFQDGPLQNLSVLLQVYNLENEPFRATAAGFADRPREFTEYGRTYLFGVNYRF